jgi:hypothetical protein
LPHSVTIDKADLTGNDIQRETPLLEHESCRFYTQVVDSLDGRLSGLCSEGSTKLARAQTRDLGQFPDG